MGGAHFFNLVKEGDNMYFATEDENERQLWVQAIYRATGQTHKPTPPAKPAAGAAANSAPANNAAASGNASSSNASASSGSLFSKGGKGGKQCWYESLIVEVVVVL